MVLLTQSQVGVALSSLVIFLCTSALFLSGYVVQQKTLRDIQKAIKPQNIPLNAGLDVPLQFRANDEFARSQDTQIVEIKPSKGVDESMIGATRWQKAKKMKQKEGAQRTLREGTEAKKNAKGNGNRKKMMGFWGKKSVGDDEEDDGKPLSDAARRKKIKDLLIAAGEGEVPQGYRRKWY